MNKGNFSLKKRLVVSRVRKRIIKILSAFFVILLTSCASFGIELKWNKMPVLVCLPPNQNSAIMKEAFSNWQKASKDKVSFVFLTSNSCPDAQITVSYAPKKRKSNTNFSYVGNYFTKAHIEMGLLTREGKPADKDLLLSLMMHEAGHAIGIIGHTNTPSSVMQPTVKKGFYITEDSIREINKLYK